MTIALRVPILEYCWGPDGGVIRMALISSSGSRTLRFTPV